MKEKGLNGVAVVLGIIFSIITIAPYVILDLPFWAIFILLFVSNIPFVGTVEEIIVWIIAVVKVFNTPQPYDFWEWVTIILFFATCIPYIIFTLISIISKLFGKKEA